MNNDADLQGTISAVVNRLNHTRLPRVLSMKQRVINGERLGEFDLLYLERVIRDVRYMRQITKNHPRYQALFAQVVGLYADVTAGALENERLANR
tara:strand:+ start:1741 stop:2025 length:285 start_codon:yes stop_codon:yes gene_type:complete